MESPPQAKVSAGQGKDASQLVEGCRGRSVANPLAPALERWSHVRNLTCRCNWRSDRRMDRGFRWPQRRLGEQTLGLFFPITGHQEASENCGNWFDKKTRRLPQPLDERVES